MPLPIPAPDRCAVVTGASSGIGASIARELAGRGHRVVLVARSAGTLTALADELSAAGGRADALPTDLSDRDARAVLLDRIGELGLTPDILVNNAGLSTLGPVAAADPAAEMNMIEVDVMAVADLCSRFVPGMVRRSRGAVLNVASTAAFQPLPGQAGYGACKAFVLSYTHSLAGELAGRGRASRRCRAGSRPDGRDPRNREPGGVDRRPDHAAEPASPTARRSSSRPAQGLTAG